MRVKKVEESIYEYCVLYYQINLYFTAYFVTQSIYTPWPY